MNLWTTPLNVKSQQHYYSHHCYHHQFSWSHETSCSKPNSTNRFGKRAFFFVHFINEQRSFYISYKFQIYKLQLNTAVGSFISSVLQSAILCAFTNTHCVLNAYLVSFFILTFINRISLFILITFVLFVFQISNFYYFKQKYRLLPAQHFLHWVCVSNNFYKHQLRLLVQLLSLRNKLQFKHITALHWKSTCFFLLYLFHLLLLPVSLCYCTDFHIHKHSLNLHRFTYFTHFQTLLHRFTHFQAHLSKFTQFVYTNIKSISNKLPNFAQQL